MFRKVPQSSLGILRVPQLPPSLEHPGTLKNPTITSISLLKNSQVFSVDSVVPLRPSFLGFFRIENTGSNAYPMHIQCILYMGVSKNRGTPKWMVYNGKPYKNGWFGGTPIFGNIHITMIWLYRSLNLTINKCVYIYINIHIDMHCISITDITVYIYVFKRF